MFYSSGTSHNRTTHFTTFADQDMLQYAKLCQDMQRYAKIYQETKGKIDYDKGFIHLPRQYFPKTLKPLNLSYVVDSGGAIY